MQVYLIKPLRALRETPRTLREPPPTLRGTPENQLNIFFCFFLFISIFGVPNHGKRR